MTTKQYEDLKADIAAIIGPDINEYILLEDTIPRIVDALHTIADHMRDIDRSLHSHVNTDNAHNF